MATSSLLGRRIFLAAASRVTQRQAFQVTSLRAASSSSAAAIVSSSQQSSYGSHDSADFSRFGLLAAAGATLAATAIAAKERDSAKCCGIAGVVGAKGDAKEYLIEGLTILKNRGYDSAGIATMDENDPSLMVTKYASEGEKADGLNLVDQRSEISNGHNIGIAHTRWATHGGKTDANAHPHTDSSGKIALVHNGTLNNANELRKELQSRGHVFNSETDTEVIAKLIGEYYEKNGCASVKEATEQALARCDGSWGLCIMCTDCPDQLVVARNGSPLVIGIGSDRTFIASETSAFNRYTKNFISMNDGEIGILRADGSTLDLTRMQEAPDQEVKLSPAPYPHWTLKECVEQPEAIARALGFGGRLTSEHVQLGGLEKMSDDLSRIKYLTLSACGTSLNAAKYAEKLMKHLGSFDMVHSLDAAETDSNDFPRCSKKAKESAFLVVSQFATQIVPAPETRG
mmetsp:Transcript_30051/g.63753  ORF Transcript_30051/g.63753 Transcript_30051/m.63753 type:complete len:458 (+) Transcript_30051:240-1613(+)